MTTLDSVTRARSSSSHWGESDMDRAAYAPEPIPASQGGCGYGGLGEALLHPPAGLAHVEHGGVARLQFGHHAAHVLDPARAKLGLDRLDRGFGFGLIHLAGQELLDHREFAALDRGQFLAPAL